MKEITIMLTTIAKYFELNLEQARMFIEFAKDIEEFPETKMIFEHSFDANHNKYHKDYDIPITIKYTYNVETKDTICSLTLSRIGYIEGVVIVFYLTKSSSCVKYFTFDYANILLRENEFEQSHLSEAHNLQQLMLAHTGGMLPIIKLV